MEWDALLLSRLQFAFTIGFHIIFPAFTIGLASFLAVLEGLWLFTKRAAVQEPLSLLGEDLRAVVRHGRRVGRGDELPVRHELERVLGAGRQRHRAAAGATKC